MQTGFFISNRLVKGNMGFESERYVVSPTDTAFYLEQYLIVQQQQFVGANFGLNKRIRISNKLQFLTGLHFQGSVAFKHNYYHQWDSSVSRNQTWSHTITTLPDLKGKNFFQWMGIIPLGLEMDVYHKMVFLRAEFDVGIVEDRYRVNPSKKETNGFGFWIIYQPRRLWHFL